MSIHPECAAVRLTDRCVQCNPGYSDETQPWRLYKDAKRYGLDAAERMELKHQKKRR